MSLISSIDVTNFPTPLRAGLLLVVSFLFLLTLGLPQFGLAEAVNSHLAIYSTSSVTRDYALVNSRSGSNFVHLKQPARHPAPPFISQSSATTYQVVGHQFIDQQTVATYFAWSATPSQGRAPPSF